MAQVLESHWSPTLASWGGAQDFHPCVPQEWWRCAEKPGFFQSKALEGWLFLLRQPALVFRLLGPCSPNLYSQSFSRGASPCLPFNFSAAFALCSLPPFVLLPAAGQAAIWKLIVFLRLIDKWGRSEIPRLLREYFAEWWKTELPAFTMLGSETHQVWDSWAQRLVSFVSQKA
jgi:hypothetical protein